jgi:inorganic pyrophosphatase
VDVNVVVEIPKGSRNKYELDHGSGRIRLDRVLYSSVHYPADYGFIEDTLAGDGDPLDALVLLEEPTFPGCLITCRPIGVFLMHDEKGEDEKILCVPPADPTWNHVTELEELPPHLLREIEHFFQTYKHLEGKPTATFGWEGRLRAEDFVRAATRA